MIKIAAGCLLLSALLIAMLWRHNVPTELTREDRVAIAAILAGRNVEMVPATYDDEIRTITTVQRAVLDASPLYRSIPVGQTREPADLLAAGKGLCFDKSRSIEKALQAVGFEVRHVAVYASIPDLLWPTKAPSHALSEVRTSRGWMLVDSITPWLGIAADGSPVSASELAADPSLVPPRPTPAEVDVLQSSFVPVVGLYSRHGQFYPPFRPLPDVNWRQLITGNFLEMEEAPQNYADGDELVVAGKLLIPAACLLLIGVAGLGWLIWSASS